MATSILSSEFSRALRGSVAIARPSNMLIASLGVLVGAILVDPRAAFTDNRVVNAMLAAAMILGAGNVVNDIFDRTIDARNRPRRPIPAGDVSVRLAWCMYVAISAVGLWFAWSVTSVHLLFAVVIAGLLLAYSVYFKRTPLAGNILVSLAVASSLAFGGLAVGRVGPSLVGAAFAFLMTLSREVMKDIQDLGGDSEAGARTTAVVLGEQPSALISTVAALLAVIVSPLPYLFAGYGPTYLALVLITDLLILVSIVGAWSSSDREIGSGVFMSKLSMIFGLVALASSSL